MAFDSYSLYGGTPPAQPTGTPMMDHPPGTPEPSVRTMARRNGPNPTTNPTMALVLIVGLAVVLVMRIRGDFD